MKEDAFFVRDFCKVPRDTALHGGLERMRDLNLNLISVTSDSSMIHNSE